MNVSWDEGDSPRDDRSDFYLIIGFYDLSVSQQSVPSNDHDSPWYDLEGGQNVGNPLPSRQLEIPLLRQEDRFHDEAR